MNKQLKRNKDGSIIREWARTWKAKAKQQYTHANFWYAQYSVECLLHQNSKQEYYEALCAAGKLAHELGEKRTRELVGIKHTLFFIRFGELNEE